jgi:hypothetical protein
MFGNETGQWAWADRSSRACPPLTPAAPPATWPPHPAGRTG